MSKIKESQEDICLILLEYNEKEGLFHFNYGNNPKRLGWRELGYFHSNHIIKVMNFTEKFYKKMDKTGKNPTFAEVQKAWWLFNCKY